MWGGIDVDAGAVVTAWQQLKSNCRCLWGLTSLRLLSCGGCTGTGSAAVSKKMPAVTVGTNSRAATAATATVTSDEQSQAGLEPIDGLIAR